MSIPVEMKIWMAMRKVLLDETSLIAPVEGVSSPSPSGTFISVINSPSPPNRMFLKSRQKQWRTGILTLVYVEPIGQSREYYMNKALEISGPFHEGRKMQYQGVCVEVANHPHIQEGYRDDGDWRVPINVNWRSLA